MRGAGIIPGAVRDAHPYTREDVPWIIGEPCSVRDRLFRYLSGGGMRTFGRTITQELARKRHRRFLFAAAAIAVAWAVFYVV